MVGMGNGKFSLAFATTFLAGCYLFDTQGSFYSSNYEIMKIEVDGSVLLSPQGLVLKAKEEMDSKGEVSSRKEQGKEKQSPAHENSEADIVDSGLDQSEPTPPEELAKIKFKATFNIDKSNMIIYGKLGCNDYTSKFYWQDNSRVVISGVGSTRKLCYPHEVVEFEAEITKYLEGIYEVLKTSEGYILDNGRMKIYIK